MPLKEDHLQLQLERAQRHLADVEKGLGEGEPRRQPKWRQANARVKQIEGRLTSRNQLVNVASGAAAEDASEEASEE